MPGSTVLNQPTNSIKSLEIFSIGTWHGQTYAEADLDGMVEAFHRVGFKPPLKLGHSEDQKILLSSGLPAAGYIQSLHHKSGRLYADISDVPNQIYQLMQKKAYDRVSVELYLNYDDTSNGRKWPYVVKALALLGAEIPEVTNLNSISSLYYDDQQHPYRVVEFRGEEEKDRQILLDYNICPSCATEKKHVISNNEEVVTMTELEKIKEENEKLKKSMEELNAKTVEFSKTDERLKTLETENKTLAENLEKERRARRSAAIASKVSEFVRGRKITPAQAPFLEAVLKVIPIEQELTISFSRDGKAEEKKMSIEAAFDSFVASQPEYINSESLHEGIDAHDSEEKIKAYCKENKLDYNGPGYSQALRALAQSGEVK